jgi:hypothetical protein
MVIKLYIDYGSQPSRAVLALCLLNNIPHEVVETSLFKGAVSMILARIGHQSSRS